MTSPLSVGILGASGYGGAELLRRLLPHPHVRVTALGSRQYLGQPVAACWPQLAGVSELDALRFLENEAVIDACDVLFCATPHGATAPLVAQARAAGKRVIDLSADFRLPLEHYEHWYGPHPHPELLDEARYGLVELHRRELPGAELLAVPGCNSSSAILALAPLAAHGLLGDSVAATILTGVSGAGRGAAAALHYPEQNENARPYKPAGTHRHTAEIELSLGRLRAQGRHVESQGDAEPVTVTFTPHLVPMTRGILATCITRPEAHVTLDDARLLELYRDFYEDDPMVTVTDDLPQTKAVWGGDRTLVSARVDARSGHVVAFAAIDNLGKGAAGQAVQGFNVVMGFPETLGLVVAGVWP
jgi:N-acetyl-gamma-glutamyl-phosphate reductase